MTLISRVKVKVGQDEASRALGGLPGRGYRDPTHDEIIGSHLTKFA